MRGGHPGSLRCGLNAQIGRELLHKVGTTQVRTDIQSVMATGDTDVFRLPTPWTPATLFATIPSQAKRRTTSMADPLSFPFDWSQWGLEVRSPGSHPRYRGMEAHGYRNRDSPL